MLDMVCKMLNIINVWNKFRCCISKLLYSVLIMVVINFRVLLINLILLVLNLIFWIKKVVFKLVVKVLFILYNMISSRISQVLL